MKIESNYQLLRHNTFGISARAKRFANISTVEELKEVLAICKEDTEKSLILGGGSNLLFTDDYDGMVLKNNLMGIEIVAEDESTAHLRVGAGENWHKLVEYTIEKGLYGLENLSLIPGNAGAAPMQNIGAYGVEIESVFEQLEAIHRESGEVTYFSKKDCNFGYRNSVFKNKYKDAFAITSIELKLSKKPFFNTAYGDIEKELETMGVSELSASAISQAVIRIRSRKLPNPEKLGNAGSFFKNPIVTLAKFQHLQEQFPDIIGYPHKKEAMKLAAGWMIQKAGWKGKKINNCGVHEQQALVLVNYGGSTGKEVWELALEVQRAVYQLFDVELTPEVNII